MGLDYHYLLYFKREQLRDVLQGVAAMSEPYDPPTKIQFPNDDLRLPIKGKEARFDDPEIGFDTVLIFDEDDAILNWGHGQPVKADFRSPLPKTPTHRVSVGYIYLTVYNNLSAFLPEADLGGLVLFDFGTTGTKMSMLFAYSTTIRRAFIGLLEKHKGVCVVFNREEEGEVFWLDGKEISAYIEDPWLMPKGIRRQVNA